MPDKAAFHKPVTAGRQKRPKNRNYFAVNTFQIKHLTATHNVFIKIMTAIYFQTVSGRVTGCNSATFDAKTGRYLSVNSIDILRKTMNRENILKS